MPSKPANPKNWPDTVPYLTESSLSPSLRPIHLEAIHSPANSRENLVTIPLAQLPWPNPFVRIVAITADSTHPAKGQSGLHTTKFLEPGAFILPYLGVIHGTMTMASAAHPDPHAESDYDLSLDRFLGLGIDAEKAGNEARFINDYRGVEAKPNVEFKEVWMVGVGGQSQGMRGMGVFVLPEGKKGKFKGIPKGNELLVSYGRGFWGERKGKEESEGAAEESD